MFAPAVACLVAGSTAQLDPADRVFAAFAAAAVGGFVHVAATRLGPNHTTERVLGLSFGVLGLVLAAGTAFQLRPDSQWAAAVGLGIVAALALAHVLVTVRTHGPRSVGAVIGGIGAAAASCVVLSEVDRLWFVGDLVNRGPRSLDVLRRVHSLGDAAVVVLGNHDLHLLAIARGGAAWSRPTRGCARSSTRPTGSPCSTGCRATATAAPRFAARITLFHAGIPPQWDLATARRCAGEVEACLRGPRVGALFEHMYGDEPVLWAPN